MKGHQSRGWLRLTELEWRLHLDPPHLDILPGGGPGHQGPAAVPLTHRAQYSSGVTSAGAGGHAGAAVKVREMARSSLATARSLLSLKT